MARPTMRVVSLVPSLTESVIEMGVTPIACTRFCEQPTLAHVGGTKNPDLAAIIASQPDVVLMDREENRREDADALRAAGVDLHITQVRSVGDVEPMLAALAARLGLDPPQPSSESTSGSAPSVVAAAVPPISAFVPIWRRPWMTISGATYGSSLLAAVGVANVFADHEDPYPTVTLDAVAARAPALVLLPSEPYAFEARHADEIREAIPGVTVVAIDGQDLFWWGTRTPLAMTRVGAAIAQVSTAP